MSFLVYLFSSFFFSFLPPPTLSLFLSFSFLLLGYLADALALRLPLDSTKLGVTEENVKEVEEAAKKAGGFGLNPLKVFFFFFF